MWITLTAHGANNATLSVAVHLPYICLCAFRVFASKRHQNAAIKWNVIDYMDNASQRHINHYKIYLPQFDSSESWLKSSISNLLMEPESDFEWIPFIYTSCDTYMGREHDNIWINDRFSTNTRDDHTRHLFIQHKHSGETLSTWSIYKSNWRLIKYMRMRRGNAITYYC